MTRIFSRHFWLLHLLFAAAAAWLASHMAVLVIQDRISAPAKAGPARRTPPSSAPLPEPYERFSAVIERNLFNPAERGQKPAPLNGKKGGAPSGAAAEGGSASAPGNYHLVGTITGPAGHSWAILQEKGSRKQQIFRIQGTLDGGKIVKITRHQIQVEREGRMETLDLAEEEAPPRRKGKPAPAARAAPPAPGGEEVKKLGANRFLVNREDVTAAVGDINRFMTQARLKPHFEAGKPVGYSVSEVVPGSLVEKLGLRNNDVIKTVNGMAVTRPEEVMQAYAQLQNDANIELEIERGGKSEVLRYEVR